MSSRWGENCCSPHPPRGSQRAQHIHSKKSAEKTPLNSTLPRIIWPQTPSTTVHLSGNPLWNGKCYTSWAPVCEGLSVGRMVFQPIGCFLLSFWSTDLWSTDFSHLLGAMKHFQNKSISLTIHPNMCLLYMHSWNLEDGQDMAHSGSLRGVGLVGDRLSAFTLCFLILGYKSNFYFKKGLLHLSLFILRFICFNRLNNIFRTLVIQKTWSLQISWLDSFFVDSYCAEIPKMLMGKVYGAR